MGAGVPRRAAALLPLLLAIWMTTNVAGQVELGSLSMEQHDVSGTVFAIDDRTLEIRDFVYDGEGPDAFFWVDEGSSATSDGTLLRVIPTCSDEPLDEIRGETVRVEVGEGKTIADYGYLSVWCRRVGVEFGGLAIDQSLLSGLSEGTPVCAANGGSEGGTSDAFPVAEGMNCETLLADRLQVRWKVSGDNLDVELVGRIGASQYMGFGPSGDDERTNMVGADPAIAYQNSDDDIEVLDYFMDDRSQCSAGRGVCPDTLLATPGDAHIENVEGERSGDLVRASYSRPLAATDGDSDRPFSTTGETFIVWAIGPINTINGIILPQYHDTLTIPQGESVSFDFGRTVVNNCEALAAGSEQEQTFGEPWDRPVILAKEDEPIIAQIGPSGGERGLSAIAQREGWGIAFYMNQIIAGTIGVERGKTYTFRASGGDDPEDNDSFHPLYITSDKNGGPGARATETIYAGAGDPPTEGVTGAICRIESTEDTIRDADTYDEYYASLDTSCTTDPAITEAAGTLTWTVAADTPDIVYYQCFTHSFLGWRIRVFDEGEMTEEELLKVNVEAKAESDSESSGPQDCSVTFKGDAREFQGCSLNLAGGVSVYWNFDEDNERLETLFAGTPDEGGYVGWGWGSSQMVGTNAAIAYAGEGGEAVIEDYFLESRSSAGVQIAGNQNFTESEADVNDDGVVMGFFVRPLEGITRGDTDAVWAVGPPVSAPDALSQHSRTNRATGTIDLSQTSASSGTGSVGLATVWKVHGALMGIAWIGLAPLAITAMRYFKKFNPATFQFHRGAMVAAFIIALVAYIIGVSRGSRTERAHLAIGSLVLILGLGQVVGGTLRPDKGTDRRPLFNIGHAWLGRIAFVLAAVNVYIGLRIAEASRGLYILVGLVLLIAILANLILGLAFSKQFPTKEVEVSEGEGAALDPGQEESA